MTTHQNLNVVGQISRAASPPSMKNGKGQLILGVLPMFRKYLLVYVGRLIKLTSLDAFRHLRHGQVREFPKPFTSSDNPLTTFLLFRLINYPLTIGIPVVVLPKFIDTLFFGSIQKYKITYAFLVPPIILHLANNPIAEKFDLSSLQNVMSGAAPLGAGLTKKVKQRFPWLNVSQGYGEKSRHMLLQTLQLTCNTLPRFDGNDCSLPFAKCGGRPTLLWVLRQTATEPSSPPGRH